MRSGQDYPCRVGSLLDDIIDGAIDDDVSTSNLLRRVKVVAHRLEAEAVTSWVDSELKGYLDNATLPTYRSKLSINVLGVWAGPMGARMSQPLGPHGVPDEAVDALFTVSLNQNIAELEQLAALENDPGIPWSPVHVGMFDKWADKGLVPRMEFMGLISANRIVTRGVLRGVLDTVRNTAMELALDLQKANPDAGAVGGPTVADVPVANAVHSMVFNIYGQANVGVGGNVTQSMTVRAGDLLGLLSAAQQLGVDGDLAKELAAAVTAPERDRDGKVKKFLKTLGTNGLVLGNGIAANVIADQLTPLITQYLGG